MPELNFIQLCFIFFLIVGGTYYILDMYSRFSEFIKKIKNRNNKNNKNG